MDTKKVEIRWKLKEIWAFKIQHQIKIFRRKILQYLKIYKEFADMKYTIRIALENQ